MKKHVSEQLIGVILAALLIGAVIGCMHLMNRKDDARRSTLEQREQRREVQDSLTRAAAERDSLRLVWAKQKHERDSPRPIW